MILELATVRTSAPWLLVAVTVVALLLAIVVKKIIGKIFVLVLAAVVVLVGWQQRSTVIDFATDLQVSACASHPTFFGLEVSYPGCPAPSPVDAR